METSKDLRILFVDDETSVLSSLRRFLRKEPYQTLFAAGAEEALQLIQDNDIHIVVTDLRMPGMTGLQLIDRLRKDRPDILRCVLSATRDIEETIASINKGEVFRFISKPLEPESFKKIILDAVDYYILKTGQQILQNELASSNRRLENALDTIEQVNAAKEKLQREAQETEQRIERQFLQSTCPENLKGVSIAAVSIPSGHMDGDFFDFIRYGDDCFDLIIGDVMGKGLQSALVGAGVKFIILKTLAQYDCSNGVRVKCPTSVIDLHSSLTDTFTQVHSQAIKKLVELETFVTLCYARFDLADRKMSFLDCGHTKTIHYRQSSGEMSFLAGDNLPLGLEDNATYKPVEISLEKDDLLLFYSDGVTEVENSKGDFFDPEKLADVIVENFSLPPEKLLEEIKQSARNHAGQQDFHDDFSCIVVKITS